MAKSNKYFIMIGANDQTTMGLWQHYGDQLVRNDRLHFLPVDNFDKTDPRTRRKVMQAFLSEANEANPTHAPVRLAPVELAPGQYHPRMARPNDSHPFDSPGLCPDTSSFRKELIEAAAQLAYLVGRLEAVFQVVQPSVKTRLVFGHEIRNILIAASTEVEAQCKAILLANGATHSENMTHYAALARAMRLPDYALTFSRCPWFGVVSPFKGWSANKPLTWYSAYNDVKHNREAHFESATLENAMFAVAACAVLVLAQVGWRDLQIWRHEAREFFILDQAPRWEATEIYLQYPPVYLRPYQPVSYFAQ